MADRTATIAELAAEQRADVKPARAAKPSRYAITCSALAASAVIFCADLASPLGIAVGVLYLIPIVFAGESGRMSIVWFVGTLCGALVVAGAAFSPEGVSTTPVWLLNRGISLVAVTGATVRLVFEMKHQRGCSR